MPAYPSIANFIQKFSSTASIRNKGAAAGMGVVDGVFYINSGNGLQSVGSDNSYGVKYYVDPQNGSDSNTGKGWSSAFASMSPLDTLLAHGDTIYLRGVLRQQWQAPAVQDVTLIGVGNTPRQATSNGTPNGGGATWLSPASGLSNSLALLAIGKSTYTTESQGWSVQNIYFNNSATSMGDVLIYRGDGAGNDNGNDASHVSFIGCKFTGADSGIVDHGGCSFVYILDCEFFNFTGGTDSGVRALGNEVALPLQWVVKGNRFWNNVRHVIMPLSSAVIEDNNFAVIGSSLTTTICLSLTGGKNNSVFNNMFNRPLNTSPNATLYVGGTNDVWSNNYGSDNIFFGVPDNS